MREHEREKDICLFIPYVFCERAREKRERERDIEIEIERELFIHTLGLL